MGGGELRFRRHNAAVAMNRSKAEHAPARCWLGRRFRATFRESYLPPRGALQKLSELRGAIKAHKTLNSAEHAVRNSREVSMASRSVSRTRFLKIKMTLRFQPQSTSTHLFTRHTKCTGYFLCSVREYTLHRSHPL